MLTAYVMPKDSGFRSDLLLCTHDLTALGAVIDLVAGYAQFKALKPAPRITLATSPRPSPPSPPASSSVPHTNHVQAITSAAIFDLGRDKYLPPHGKGFVRASLPSLDADYIFSAPSESPIVPGVVAANSTQLRLEYNNATSD